MEKMTLKDFLNKKIKKENKSKEKIKIKISNDKYIECRYPNDSELANIIDKRMQDTYKVIDEYVYVIYACCSDLHDTKLQEELECETPEDIILKIFSAAEILLIGNELINDDIKLKNIEIIKKN